MGGWFWEGPTVYRRVLMESTQVVCGVLAGAGAAGPGRWTSLLVHHQPRATWRRKKEETGEGVTGPPRFLFAQGFPVDTV